MIRNGSLARHGGWRSWALWRGPWRGKNRRNRRVPSGSGRVMAPLGISPSADTGPSRIAARQRDWRAFVRVITLLLTLTLVVGGAWAGRRWLLHSPHFAVREIRISSTHHISAEALRARSGVERGDNLFMVDLGQVERDVAADPWVRRAKAHRELPGVLAIDAEERTPACVVALGPLYLADPAGEVFKRASLDEAAGMPMVTGIPRDGYIDDREASQALIREALAVLEVWREDKKRPAIGEVHIDSALGATLYTAQGGVGIRVGRGEPAVLRERFRRADAVWAAIERQKPGQQPRLILVDQRTHPDRVTVKLAAH
jgi:cell division protein FtsQ